MTTGFRARYRLMTFAVAAAMAEAGVLSVAAPGALPLAPQVSALPPLAVFHDLRWLYAESRPWPVFALMLTGFVLARAAMTATLFRLAWPRGSAPPGWRAAMRTALGLTVVLSVLMSTVVSLSVGVEVLPFSWPYLASIPVLLAIAATVSHGGMLGTWWRRLPPPAAVGWLLADFLALSAAAALIARVSPLVAIAVAGLSGLVNARAWYGVATAVLRAHPEDAVAGPRTARRAPVALLATATALGVVVAVTWVAFTVTTPAHIPRRAPADRSLGAGQGGTRQPEAGQRGTLPQGADQRPLGEQRTATARPGAAETGPRRGNGQGGGATVAGASSPAPRRLPRIAVLVVPGFGSFCCDRAQSLARFMPDAVVRSFSYRGLSRSGRPLPYGPSASNLPLPVLGDRIAAQVQQLHAITRLPVDVVAESEGTLGVDAMLAQHPHLPIGSVALLSPIVAPGRDGYASEEGLGEVPSAELSAVVWFVGGLSPYGTSGAQTLIDSVDHTGARFAEQAARRRPGRWLEVIPLADTVTLPACRLPASVRVVPAVHGVLLGDPAALRLVRDFLDGRPVAATPGMRSAAEILAGAASAWRMPGANPPSPPCRK